MPTTKKKAKKKASKKKASKKKTAVAKRPRSGRLRKGADGLTSIQRQFIETFVMLEGKVATACRALGIDKTSHYVNWLKDPTYAAAFYEARDTAEKLHMAHVREQIQRIGDPDQGWTEEIIEEEVEPITINGKTEMRVKRGKRKRVKKFSVPALLWEGNRLFGNPAHMEVNAVGTGAIQMKIPLDVFRSVGAGDDEDKSGAA